MKYGQIRGWQVKYWPSIENCYLIASLCQPMRTGVHALSYIPVSINHFMCEYTRCMIHVITLRRWSVAFYVLSTGEFFHHSFVEKNWNIRLTIQKNRTLLFVFGMKCKTCIPFYPVFKHIRRMKHFDLRAKPILVLTKELNEQWEWMTRPYNVGNIHERKYSCNERSLYHT